MSEDCECYAEVARLHRFFQDWFQGILPEDDFVRCEQALAPGFVIVTPGGNVVERTDILDVIRVHRGGESADFSIETIGRLCRRLEDLHLTIYEERQHGPRSTVRLSTAVLEETAGGFGWHSVHETWITG